MSIGATSGKTKSILTPHGCRSAAVLVGLKTKQEMESGDFSIRERLLYFVAYFTYFYLATKMLMAPYDV